MQNHGTSRLFRYTRDFAPFVVERVELAVPGEHMVPNALAAVACGWALGVSVAECAAALKGAHVSAWRMETFTSPDGLPVRMLARGCANVARPLAWRAGLGSVLR